MAHMTRRNWGCLAIMVLVCYVVASGIWQNVERWHLDARLQRQLTTPCRDCFLVNIGGFLNWSETHGIYVVYDRTMTKVSENGDLSSPKGVWLRPELSQSRLEVVQRLRVEDRFYELQDNTVCWVTKHKGDVQVTIQPLNVEHFVEDFADFVEGYCQTQTQRPQNKTFSSESATFKTLSLARGNVVVAYSALHNTWILSKNVFSENEMMVQPSPIPSKMPTLRIGGVDHPLKENMLYTLTKHNGDVRIDGEPFELFNLLIGLESFICRSYRSQKTETPDNP